MIALDLCQPHCQVLFITYLKSTKKNAMHVWKEKKSNQKECGKRCFKSIKGSIKKHPSLYQFCKGDINKFVLLLRKNVYPYEYMDSWERFEETLLLDKKRFLQ